MTLATLAYVSENVPANIKADLIEQLQTSSYSTDAQWQLAWGPALSPDNSNLMYVVQNIAEQNVYALVLRGTDICFLSNLEEDLEVWKLVEYPYSSSPNPNVTVAAGTLQGATDLLNIAAPNTLSAFLSQLPGPEIYLFITGHSLGGALATLFTSWAIDTNSQWGNKFRFKIYTFAAPSIGNSAYVGYFQQQLQNAGTESYRVWNTSDAIPYFWDKFLQLPFIQYPGYSKPGAVWALVFGITGAIQYYFNKYSIQYEPVAISYPLDNPAPFPTCQQMPTQTDAEEIEQYACYIESNHATSTYLSLIGAPSVNFSNTSNCPPPAVPRREPTG